MKIEKIHLRYSKDSFYAQVSFQETTDFYSKRPVISLFRFCVYKTKRMPIIQQAIIKIITNKDFFKQTKQVESLYEIT